MLTARLYMLQRITALIMVPLIVGHLATMIYAIQGGVSAGEILSRTQGSMFWVLFYGIFVSTVSIHAAIGLRVILAETTGMRSRYLDVMTLGTGLGFLYMGARAVMAVTMI